MAATATATRAKRAKKLETKSDKADPKAKDDAPKDNKNEIKSIQEETERLLKETADIAKELTEQKSDKGEVDPLTDQKADRVIAALHANTDALKEIKSRQDALEAKGQRPDLEGREALDEYGVSESKSDDQFDLEHKAAFAAYACYGDEEPLRTLGFELKDMSTLSDPDGGYFVREEMDMEITRVVTEYGGFRELADVRQTSAKSMKKRVNMGRASAGWIGEKEARPKTGTPQAEELELQTGELYAKPQVTQQELEDAYIDIEELLAQEIGLEFSVLEAEAFVTGDGSNGKPRGILTHTMKPNDSAGNWGEFGYIKTGVNGALPSTTPGDEYQKLVDFQHSLKRSYRRNASFIMTDLTKSVLRKVLDADGRPLLVTDAQNGGITTLFGKSIVEVDEMPETSENSFSIGFGDWRRTYRILDRIGTSVLRDPYSSKPYIEFYTRKRVGGGVIMFESAKFLQFKA